MDSEDEQTGASKTSEETVESQTLAAGKTVTSGEMVDSQISAAKETVTSKETVDSQTSGDKQTASQTPQDKGSETTVSGSYILVSVQYNKYVHHAR